MLLEDEIMMYLQHCVLNSCFPDSSLARVFFPEVTRELQQINKA